MDTIRVYLDNMFKALPNNQKVRDAKAELFSMMEDKYYLLKEEGKTENEAVGIVINEFGNLDEVAEILGISREMDDKKEILDLKHEDVVEAVETHKFVAPKIALATFSIMLGVSLLLFVMSLQELEILPITEDAASYIGIAILIVLVAFAVHHYIYYGMKLEGFERYEKELVQVSYEDRKFLEDTKEKTHFSKTLAQSVILYVISPLPVILGSLVFNEKDAYVMLGVTLTTLIIAIGVYKTIKSSIVDGICDQLLQIGNFTPQKKQNIKKYGYIYSAFWLLTTAIYFAVSLITMKWGMTWIIWPIAGVVFGLIYILLNRD